MTWELKVSLPHTCYKGTDVADETVAVLIFEQPLTPSVGPAELLQPAAAVLLPCCRSAASLAALHQTSPAPQSFPSELTLSFQTLHVSSAKLLLQIMSPEMSQFYIKTG